MGGFSVAEVDSFFELETKRKDNSSWHPCRVSLTRQEMEDMFLKKEEVVMHLRFRSTALQSDDCCCIEEGERFLA